jgi:hypothetical protein
LVVQNEKNAEITTIGDVAGSIGKYVSPSLMQVEEFCRLTAIKGGFINSCT